jgi:Fe-Mn family superoxide dismutase
MQDIRDLITLVESKEHLEQLDLDYSRSALAPVLSQANISNHYGKLYRGYVDRFNKGEGDPAFNKAGAFLHNIWFGQLRPPRNVNAPTGASLALINRKFDNFLDFKKDFKEAAMKIQGSGWIYLSRSGEIKTIKNHQIKNDIALLIDWWEHAWVLDYGSKKDKYLDSIWRIVDWEAVNRRIYSNK